MNFQVKTKQTSLDIFWVFLGIFGVFYYLGEIRVFLGILSWLLGYFSTMNSSLFVAYLKPILIKKLGSRAC